MKNEVSEILKNYVFEFRSFKMPCDLFLEYFKSKPISKRTRPEPKRVVCALNSTASTRKSLDMSSDSLYRTTSLYKSTALSSVYSTETPSARRSLSAKKIRTYSELYERKKDNQRFTFRRSSRIFDKIEEKLESNRFFAPKQSIIDNSITVHKSFASKYANAETLMEIRRQHLKYSSLK